MQSLTGRFFLVKRMIYAQKKEQRNVLFQQWLDIFGALWACLCVYRRWQQCACLWEHNALVCGFDKYWQRVWEKLSYCAGISRTVRCVNAKAKKKGVGEQETTNRQIKMDQQGDRQSNWLQQITDDRFSFFLSCFLLHFVVALFFFSFLLLAFLLCCLGV